MKKHILVLGLALSLSLMNGIDGNAQYWLGASMSNQSATHSAYVNPAILGGAKKKLYINAIGIGFNAMNDFVSWGAPFTVREYITGNVPDQYKDSVGNVAFNNDWLVQNLDGSNKNLYFETEIRGPAAMIRVSEKTAISFGMRSRTGFSITNVSENLAKLAVNGVDTGTLSSNTQINIGSNIDNLRVRFNALSYQEFSLGFGKQFLQLKALKVKLGATAKLLVGNAYFYAQGDNFDLQINGIDSFRVDNADFRYGYSDLSQFENFNPSSLLPTLNGNVGFAWDAGAVVEYAPIKGEEKRSKNSDYLFRAGLSLIDVGRINFSNDIVNQQVRLKSPFTFVTDSAAEQAFEDGPFSENASQFIDSVIDANFDITNSTEAIYQLPAMLSFQFDYNLFKNFYLGMLWFQDIRGIDFDKIRMRRPSQITLIPRFESTWVEASLPINLSGDYKVLQLGGFVRVGPVYAGSDNLRALLTQKNMYGVNFYLGFAQSIGDRKKAKEDAKKQAQVNFVKSVNLI